MCGAVLRSVVLGLLVLLLVVGGTGGILGLQDRLQAVRGRHLRQKGIDGLNGQEGKGVNASSDSKNGSENERNTTEAENQTGNSQVNFWSDYDFDLSLNVDDTLRKKQPFYLMSITGSIKAVVTLACFGFTISFEKPKESTFIPESLIPVQKYLPQILFLGMALNTLQEHVMELVHSGPKTLVGASMALVFVAVTSSNFVSAFAFESAFTPKNIFGARAKNTSWPTHLGPLEVCFKIVMAIYWFVFESIGVAVFDSQSWLWCKPFYCKYICVQAKCYGCLLLTVISFGLSRWARETFSQAVGMAVPMWYAPLIYVQCTFVAFVACALYGLVHCASFAEICKAFDLASRLQFTTLMQQDHLKMQQEDDVMKQIRNIAKQNKLWDLQKKELKDSYSYVQQEDPTEQNCREARTSSGVDDATRGVIVLKMVMILDACFKVRKAIILQLSCLFMLRYCMAENMTEAVEGWWRTATERTMLAYFNRMVTGPAQETWSVIADYYWDLF